MTNAHCTCGNNVKLQMYKLIKHDALLLYRLYFGNCICGEFVEKEEWNEFDQVYLDCPELMEFLI
jgi:hypothetical protein